MSFVEVLVAGIAMVALLVPLLLVFSRTLRTTEVSLQEVVAQHLASELMEQLQVLPYSTTFQWIPTRPVPNPFPAYPNWTSLDPEGDDLPIEGMLIPPDDKWPGEAEGEIVTGDWKRTGRSILWMEGTSPAPELLERSRLFLSPMPKGFRRYLQLYRPLRSSSPLTVEENLVKAVVKIEWPSARTSDGSHMRRIVLRSLIANPRVW